jgi:hypothetical protein|tara:strand:+ start:1202 stop:1429 length:228 start_codon:yes stop_codon:yes gene_type:complete
MGLDRKIARKQQKTFMKDFKKSMQQFKKIVACSSCGRAPEEGQNIDDWKINQNSASIELLCTDCFGTEEDWQNEV